METFEEDDMPLSALQNLKQEKNNFSCPTCQSSFRKKTKLVQHQYYQHGFGIMCKICLRTFSNLSACVTHLSTKHSDQGYPCSHCDFKTTKQSEFRNHIQEQHNLSTQMGGIKVKEERNEDSSKNGESNHVKENTKSDASENLMVKELINDKKKYICDLCGACFAIKNQLLKHNNEKHGLNVSCDICSQTFNSMVSLRSHKFTKHTGKDKICEICGYSTKKTYDFKRHQVKHSNIFTVKCVVCNKGFYSLYEFNEHKNVHTAERPYQCEICGVDYSRRSSLTLHRNRKHPEQYDSSKKCKICNQVCLTRDTMEAHVKTHLEGRKKFYCDICGKGLLTKVILKVHRRSHTGEKPFDCSYCGRAFSCKKNLSVHIRLHTGVRPYSCKYCWKAYTKSSALKAHEKIHSAPQSLPEPEAVATGEGPSTTKLKLKELNYDNKTNNADLSSTKVPCELCGESYQKNLLQRHKKRHLKAQNSHKCELCEYSFTMMTKLVLHRKKSHGLEMSCDKCEKSFQNVHSFTTHIRNHKKDKSFVCDVCGLAMTEKRNLDKHKLVRHKIGEFPFQCKICKKGFLSNYFLNEHMNRHTGARPHQCHKCGSAYASFKNLERHNYRFHPELLKNKILRCKCCSRVFKSKKKLEIHEIEKHSNGRNVCDFCGKDFKYRESLIRHRRIHTGEKPKECSVCKKKFACANYLQNHMRTHTGEKPYQCRFCWKKFSQRSGVVTHEKIHLRGLKSSGLEIIPAVSKS